MRLTQRRAARPTRMNSAHTLRTPRQRSDLARLLCQRPPCRDFNDARRARHTYRDRSARALRDDSFALLLVSFSSTMKRTRADLRPVYWPFTPRTSAATTTYLVARGGRYGAKDSAPFPLIAYGVALSSLTRRLSTKKRAPVVRPCTSASTVKPYG